MKISYEFVILIGNMCCFFCNFVKNFCNGIEEC